MAGAPGGECHGVTNSPKQLRTIYVRGIFWWLVIYICSSRMGISGQVTMTHVSCIQCEGQVHRPMNVKIFITTVPIHFQIRWTGDGHAADNGCLGLLLAAG